MLNLFHPVFSVYFLWDAGSQTWSHQEYFTKYDAWISPQSFWFNCRGTQHGHWGFKNLSYSNLLQTENCCGGGEWEWWQTPSLVVCLLGSVQSAFAFIYLQILFSALLDQWPGCDEWASKKRDSLDWKGEKMSGGCAAWWRERCSRSQEFCVLGCALQPTVV